MQADIYGTPLDLVAAEEEQRTRGAAGRCGSGSVAVGGGACETAVHVAKRVEPITKNVELMSRSTRKYQKCIRPADD